MVLWRPAFFGIKPELVIKGGFIAWGAMGDSAASLMTCEPFLHAAAMGRIRQGQAGAFAPASSIRWPSSADIAGLARPRQDAASRRRHTGLDKQDMLHNDACPEIKVDPQTFDVLSTASLRPASRRNELPLAQRYMLR